MDEDTPGVLFQAGRYVVIAINDFLLNNRVTDAYAVVNLQTQVAEYESRFLWDAMQWCKRCELLVAKYLADNEPGLVDWPDDEEEEEDDEDEEPDDE